jgi:hypothetical protein
MPGVQTESINSAVAALLAPQEEPEQEEQAELEQEVLEDEEAVEDETEEEVVEDEESEEETEESEEESDEDELEEEATEEEDEEPEAELFTVKVDGEEYEVSLEELKKGYGLEKHVTKKAQAAAEQLKEAEALKTQLAEERNKYIQLVQQKLQDQASSLQKYEQVDWAKLKDEDPMRYVEMQAEKQEAERVFVEERNKAQQALSEAQEQDKIRMAQYIQEQSHLLETSLDGWNDPEQRVAIQKGILDFARSQGYSDAELANVHSARDLIILNKARQFDELQTKKRVVKKKRTAPKSKQVRAGGPKSEGLKVARQVKAKKEEFKRSGSVKDAQQLMVDLMTKKAVRK